MTSLTITTHRLKIEPIYFAKVLTGEKPFEIRWNDRGYQRGDILLLCEYQPETDDDRDSDISATESDRFTGRTHRVQVTYVTSFHQKPGFVVMGIAAVEDPDERRAA